MAAGRKGRHLLDWLEQQQQPKPRGSHANPYSPTTMDLTPDLAFPTIPYLRQFPDTRGWMDKFDAEQLHHGTTIVDQTLQIIGASKRTDRSSVDNAAAGGGSLRFIFAQCVTPLSNSLLDMRLFLRLTDGKTKT